MSDVLFEKFKYNISDKDNIRIQCLRNAYIHFGFNELKNILKTLEITGSVLHDIDFLAKEEREINS